MLEYWNVEVLGCRSIGMSEYLWARGSEYSDVRVLECPSAEVSEYYDVRVLGVRVLGCQSIGCQSIVMSEYWGVRVL